MILVVFLVYLLVLAFIGVYYSRANRALEDFVLGGRRLGPWVAAVSAEASDMSGWLLIGAAFTQLWPVLLTFCPTPAVTIWPGALIPSFFLSCLTIWAVSLLTGRRGSS